MIEALRRLGRVGPIRKLLAYSRVEPIVVRALPATTTRALPRFLIREFRVGGTDTYRLRGAPLVVEVRHRTPDVAVLGEVFYERVYQPPPLAAAALAAVPAPLSVLDLGANIGLFSLYTRSVWPSAAIVAVEPDPRNLPLLRRNLDRNGGGIEVVEAAASTRAGTSAFAGGAFSSSRIASAADAATVEVRTIDVFPLVASSDFVKIDIEGAEWAILADPRFESVAARVLVLEYHAHGSPTADAEAAVRERLTFAGYELGDGRRFAPGHGMVWAWRR